jgi:predicted DNA-binding transcriptional regulator YafY
MQKRLKRLARLLKELRRRQFVSTNDFCRTLEEEEFMKGAPYPVCERTVRRDIEFLVKDLQAPIQYDPSAGGYELRNRFWQIGI